MITAHAWQDWEKCAPMLVLCCAGWSTVCEEMGKQSCTSGPNQWLEPKSINDFTSANRCMKKFHQGADEY